MGGLFGKLFKKSADAELEVINMYTDAGEIIVISPLKGKVIPLSEVKDEVFSQGMLGKGTAIIPEEGKVYAPVSGTVTAVLPSKHAVGITGADNLQILIHVGTDTVNLNGKYFESHVKQGQRIKSGDLLIEFDIEGIKSEGYEVVTPVVVTNSGDYKEVRKIDSDFVNDGEDLLYIKKV